VLSGEVNANLVSMYEPDPEMVKRNFVIQADDTGPRHKVIEKPRYVNSQLKGLRALRVRPAHLRRDTPHAATAMRDEYEITDSIQILINDGYITHHHPIAERDLNLTKPAGSADHQPDRAGAKRPGEARRRLGEDARRARRSIAASSARTSPSRIRSASPTP
jgi:dTDP-glucose pyrophosphorylase